MTFTFMDMDKEENMEEGDVPDPSTALIEELWSSKAELSTVEALIEAGADVNARDSTGTSAVQIALLHHNEKYKDITFLLFGRGAKVNLEPRCLLPIHNAICCDSLWTIRKLLKKGADINACASNGPTPLIYAAITLKQEAMSLLMKMGADIACQNRDQDSALHLAAWNGWPDEVEYLLDRNCDPNQRNRHGQTPLHYASQKGGREVIELLVEAGGDCHLKDDCGKSMLAVFNLSNPDPFEIRWDIEFGAEVRLTDFETFPKNFLTRATILRDVNICSQAIMNNLKNSDLSLVNSSPVIPGTPLTDEMSKVLDSVKLIIMSAVNCQIQLEGYFNVMQTRPCSLSMLCLRFLIDFPQ